MEISSQRASFLPTPADPAATAVPTTLLDADDAKADPPLLLLDSCAHSILVDEFNMTTVTISRMKRSLLQLLQLMSADDIATSGLIQFTFNPRRFNNH